MGTESQEPGCTYITQKGELTMNLCIPITEDQGLQSPVSGHFGSAPYFMIVDTGSRHS